MNYLLCYLCKTEKKEEEFIKRKDGLIYKICKLCNKQVQTKKKKNKNKNLTHTESHRTCYKCMRFLKNEKFTLRSVGTFYSACKDCNKYEFQHKRRSLLSNSKGSYTSREFEELLKKNPVCPICKRKWDQIPLPKNKKVPWTADHIVPINPVEGEKKGTNYISNIQPLCFSCNSKKGNRQ
jgi:5-methylcytosine-specific restriction endonuclease McrA